MPQVDRPTLRSRSAVAVKEVARAGVVRVAVRVAAMAVVGSAVVAMVVAD